jgi:hypothetical protein
MSLTAIDLEETGVEARAVVERWEAEFQERFHEPELMAQRVMQALVMTTEQRAELKQQDPQMYARIESHVKRMRRLLNYA